MEHQFLHLIIEPPFQLPKCKPNLMSILCIKHFYAKTSKTTKAREKICTALKSLKFQTNFDACWNKFKRSLMNKISHQFLVTTKVYTLFSLAYWPCAEISQSVFPCQLFSEQSSSFKYIINCTCGLPVFPEIIDQGLILSNFIYP